MKLVIGVAVGVRARVGGKANWTWGKANWTWGKANWTWGKANWTWGKANWTWGKANWTWGKANSCRVAAVSSPSPFPFSVNSLIKLLLRKFPCPGFGLLAVRLLPGAVLLKSSIDSCFANLLVRATGEFVCRRFLVGREVVFETRPPRPHGPVGKGGQEGLVGRAE